MIFLGINRDLWDPSENSEASFGRLWPSAPRSVMEAAQAGRSFEEARLGPVCACATRNSCTDESKIL